MSTLCAAVIARDEERNMERCLGSLQWADSLLVLMDDRTTDATAEISQLCGATVISGTFQNYAHQRNRALELATGDWVLFVDADEVVPPDLAAEVREIVDREDTSPGYWVARKNILFGRWMRHAGWSPDYQLRLLRRGSASYDEGRTVHELVKLDGEAGHLRNALVHYNYDSVGQFLAKQQVYASMAASDMFHQGIRPKPHNYLLQPWRQFWRRFVVLEGYRDGWLGLFLSILLAYYEFETYVSLGTMRQTQHESRG